MGANKVATDMGNKLQQFEKKAADDSQKASTATQKEQADIEKKANDEKNQMKNEADKQLNELNKKIQDTENKVPVERENQKKELQPKLDTLMKEKADLEKKLADETKKGQDNEAMTYCVTNITLLKLP